MVRSKQVSLSQEKNPGKMTRQEALDTFKRIAEATGTLAWRDGYRKYMEKLDQEQARQFQESIKDERPPDEELRARLETDTESYGAFWDARLSHMKFFEDGYGWLPECKGLVIGKEGAEPISLWKASCSEMAILMTEDVLGYSSRELDLLRDEVSYCFNYGQIDIEELIPAMHDDTVSRFLSFLDGEQIAGLIENIAERMEFKEFSWTGTIAKIARALGNDMSGQIWELGDFCIRRSGMAYGIRDALHEYGGEDGRKVVDDLIKYMDTVASELMKNIERLKGESHD